MTAQVIYQLKTDSISAEDFGGELVVVNFSNGKYYGLAGAAPMIWSLLAAPSSLDEVMNEVSRRTGAPRQQVESSIAQFLRQLQDEELVSVLAHAGVTAPISAEHNSAAGDAEEEFKIPELTVYSDLQELILLDPVHDADPDHGWPIRRQDHLDRK